MSNILPAPEALAPITRFQLEPVLQVLPELQDETLQMDLRGVAFENHHQQVFHAWLNLDQGKRQQALRDRYIFLSVASCVEPHLANLLKLDRKKANAFVDEIIDAATLLAGEKRKPVVEWFRGLDYLASAFTDHNYLPAARTMVAIGFTTGVVNFPSVAQSLNVHAAYLDALMGRREKAAKLALKLVRRPYLLPNCLELPKVYQKLMYVLSASNHLREYKEVIWRGASNCNAESDVRGMFIDQIARTYRGLFRSLMHGEIRIEYRVPFIIGYIERLLRAPWAAWTKAYVIAGWLHWGCLYLLNRNSFRMPVYHQPREARRLAAGVKRPRKRILITRASGGIGDLLMMTPGIRALAMRYPKAQIDFAIPKSFHPLFEGFSAARLLDINGDEIDMNQYTKWVNFTDCPAVRKESLEFPNVKSNRIEIFARSMGISRWRLKRTAGCLPSYKVSPEEQQWAKDYIRERNGGGLPVIGIQPFTADTYKDWPFMEELALVLSKDHFVLVFHNEAIPGYLSPNIHQPLATLRKNCALAEQCTSLIVGDSSFLHISATIGVKTLALFGPTSAKVFCRYYKNVRYMTPRKPEFPCFPCWRNEDNRCHLTNGRESICFRSIQVNEIIGALNRDREHWPVKQGILSTFKSWAFYGRQ